MTLHIIVPTLDADGDIDGFVWAADTLVTLGWGNQGHVEKITHVKEHKVACSTWGDRSITVRDEFAKRVKNGAIQLSESDENNIQLLRQFATEMVPEHEHNSPGPDGQYRPNRGLIVATYFGALPAIYAVGVVTQPWAWRIDNFFYIAGDFDNPAQIFLKYYYFKMSGKSLEEAILMATHATRVAQVVKWEYIGPPNVWYCRNGEFKHVPRKVLSGYVRLSESLDDAIAKQLRKIAPKRKPSPVMALLLQLEEKTTPAVPKSTKRGR
jgi:hypothetical protein